MEQRCDRVRKNLASIDAAVQRKIDLGSLGAAAIMIFGVSCRSSSPVLFSARY
jgi:hypothetical protein